MMRHPVCHWHSKSIAAMQGTALATLVQDSLAGNAKAMMFIHVAPEARPPCPASHTLCRAEHTFLSMTWLVQAACITQSCGTLTQRIAVSEAGA